MTDDELMDTIKSAGWDSFILTGKRASGKDGILISHMSKLEVFGTLELTKLVIAAADPGTVERYEKTELDQDEDKH